MENCGLGNCKSIDEFVNYKLEKFKQKDKNFQSVFEIMTLEKENIFCETNDGYLIEKVTYGDFERKVKIYSNKLGNILSKCDYNSYIGMYMQNSEKWLEIFWALLMSGFRPVLLNTRMSESLLLKTMSHYDIKYVISDRLEFENKTIFLKDIDNTNILKQVKNSKWADEIVLMSSGTTENVKLCTYTGLNIYYQILDSAEMIKKCKIVKKHYDGSLKLLTFLPFYHIFGLFAVHMWFGFFSRTFVFLNKLDGDTILNTIKLHKVTHVFAVPMLWNLIYKSAINTIKKRGDKTYNKFLKGMSLASKNYSNKLIYNFITKKLFKEIRENIFGESISFLISGGSNISSEVITFFNNIGYHLANGYGMTEIGITSVELSDSSHLIEGSVGTPFSSIEYKINSEGILLVKGKTLPSKVMIDGKEINQTDNGYFITKDSAYVKDGHYYINGRHDEIIISESGENLNPNIIEPQINISRVNDMCICSTNKNGKTTPVLLLSVSKYLDKCELEKIENDANNQLASLNLDGEIQKVLFTNEKLVGEDDFKVNRIKISKRLNNNEISFVDFNNLSASSNDINDKIIELFNKVLHLENIEIKTSDNFFYDLGGTSLDFISLDTLIQEEFGVSILSTGNMNLNTVDDISNYINKYEKNE